MKKAIALWIALLMLFSAGTVFAEEEKTTIISEPFKPASVIGEDDRVTINEPDVFPYSAIGLMVVNGSCDCSWTGTCFMIGKDVAMTAAHCVCCPRHGKPARKIELYFGYKSPKDYLYHYSGSTEIWYGTNFLNSDGNYRYSFETMLLDYAYIRLKKKVGNYTGYFGMQITGDWSFDDYGLYDEICSVAGYRDGLLKVDSGKVYCNGCTMVGNKVYSDGGALLTYEIDMEAGNSGCPLYTPRFYVIGINIADDGGYANYARRYTQEIDDNMSKNLK